MIASSGEVTGGERNPAERAWLLVCSNPENKSSVSDYYPTIKIFIIKNKTQLSS